MQPSSTLLFLLLLLPQLASLAPLRHPKILADLAGDAQLSADVPTPPGPRVSPAGSRLLRDSPEPPSLDPTWARFFADFMTGQRKFRGRTRKAPAPQGCFGVKLDRIGTLSGLGC
ncbi:C-type natriuretic peptide-like [Terrapene carolina triunguis]|uniref:C-type natriuretic peptide-like n=1 Tax=Terrapene triunguis TaxID=2587831 RepID=UPI000CEF9069|nr:C-type natriuretic peptide-like [Terrapene carolina triunguis]